MPLQLQKQFFHFRFNDLFVIKKRENKRIRERTTKKKRFLSQQHLSSLHTIKLFNFEKQNVRR